MTKKRDSSDLLGHADFAKDIQTRLDDFPSGTVVSIEGDWGRGKTDLLSRLHDECEDYVRIWINPWANKDSIVVETIAKIQQITGKLPDEKLIASGLQILEMTRFGVQATQVSLSIAKPPFIPFLKVSADATISGLAQLKANLEKRQSEIQSSPGELFSALISRLLTVAEKSKKKKRTDRVLFFVDDMDRCTPDVQVHLLEQLHRLTQYGAQVIFFVAVDSTVRYSPSIGQKIGSLSLD